MTEAGPADADRVGPARPREEAGWRELARLLPEIGRLLWALARDPRVPWHAKAVAGAAVAYAVSPVDPLPDVLPIGLVDDVWVVTRAVRHLLSSAGYPVVREHWTGSDEGFALLIGVVGVDR